MTTVAEKPISLADFEANYLDEERCKYEWVNGEVIREECITRAELIIIDNILRSHYETEDSRCGNRIMAEADCYLSSIPSYRRPDAAYLSPAQINYPETAEEAPALVIEVSSPSNSGGRNIAKMLEYFKAGTRVVWYIYPEQKQVWVYTDPKEVTICHEGDVCSADPAIPGFSMNVSDVFSRPVPENK